MTITEVSRAQVVEALSERAPRAVHLGEICKRLNVDPKSRSIVQDVLDSLTMEGYVREMPGPSVSAGEEAEEGCTRGARPRGGA
jgi:DNA-binding IclR family transcriptional regulator